MECRPFIFGHIFNNAPKITLEWRDFLLGIGLMERDCNDFDAFVYAVVNHHLQHGNSIHVLRHRTHNSGVYPRAGVPFIVPNKGSYRSFLSSPPNSCGRRSSPSVDHISTRWVSPSRPPFWSSPPNHNTARRFSHCTPPFRSSPLDQNTAR